MKKILIPVGALFFAGFSKAQLTNTENYVYSKTYLDYNGTTATKTSETVQYFDGLGRPKQVVNIKASPLGRDVVTHIEYDGFGRQVRDYLPVPQTFTANGSIFTAPLDYASNPAIYGSEKIYSEKILENSPLDRLLQQKQVGNAWNNKPVGFEYDANSTADAVKKYTVTTTWENGATKSVLTQTANYAQAQLYKNTVTDEDGNKTIEFKNGEGQVLLVRKMLDTTQSADTYYVYNEYNQLAFVIPPLASAATPDDTTLNNLCYQYRYDGRNRLVEKKLPGKGWEYMVYDKADRLILTQDANMKNIGKWLISKYDQFGRVIYTGIIAGGTRESMQNQAGNLVITESRHPSGFTRNGMQIYYSNGYFLDIETVLSINYYDTYPQGSPSLPAQVLGQTVLSQDAQNSNISTKSFPTASYVKNIEDDNWTKNYTWYDTKGRVIGTHSINHLGGYTKTEAELDFAGVTKQAITRHKRLDSDTEKVITENFTYDHQNRLLAHTHKIDNNPVEYLAQNEYSELSQLKTKKVGGTASVPLQTVDYTYNIRGWMTGTNDPENLNGKLFGYKIKYTDPVNTSVSSPRFNGNIAEVDWKTATNVNDNKRRYSYQYDGLNRLLQGAYSEEGLYVVNNDFYNEVLTYDLNGNIKTLKRFSNPYSGNIAEKIDDLIYNYTGNRLDLITLPPGVLNNSSGYNALENTITYDPNGNMKTHLDKGINTISYNHLNLPTSITSGSGKNQSSISYLYRADGTKLAKFSGNPLIALNRKIDYLDGFQYESILDFCIGCPMPTDNLMFVPTSEGYFDFVKNKYIYHYNDHLGNVRLSYFKNDNNSVEVLEENNYYPFGLKHTGYNALAGNPSYNYKYNGKELQETGMYDYGARFYMPDIGRWGVVDPLAETSRRWNPYNYAYNNPLRFIDPDGRQGTDIIFRGTDKKEIRVIAAGPDKVYNVPFALNKNTTLDIGIGNIDPGRLAVGYTAQGDIGGGLGIGAGGGVQASVIQFTDSKYSGYNYVYAGAQESFSAGAQANISASIGGSVSVAYNTSKDNIDPTSYAGVTTSAGLSADVKYVVGGGVNVNAFSGSGKNPGWKGVSIGASVGVGAGANVGSGNITLSKTWLLNDVKPTAQRSLLDRATNAISPVGSAVGSAVATGVGDWVKKNVKHSPQFN